jgi:hypothetical protein
VKHYHKANIGAKWKLQDEMQKYDTMSTQCKTKQMKPKTQCSNGHTHLR